MFGGGCLRQPYRRRIAAGEVLDYAEMAKEQLLCGDIKQLLDSSSLSVLKVHIYRHDLFCDVSAAVARPLVLRQWRERECFRCCMGWPTRE
jgi:hypothetical protein